MALLRCGVSSQVKRASNWENDSGQAEQRQANPMGQIPRLLLDDGHVMTESAAILIELGWRCPASGLLPIDAAARAQAIRGLVYIAANGDAAIGMIDHPERFTTGADAAERRRARQGARGQLHALTVLGEQHAELAPVFVRHWPKA